MSETFYSNLPAGFVVGDDPIERRLLKEYGAVFVARNGILPPPKIVFTDQADVEAFQSDVKASTGMIGGLRMELQAEAMEALMRAVEEASDVGCTITPRGTDSAKRTYDETVGLWKSRVEPALEHWVAEKRIPKTEAERIAAMSPFEQVSVVLSLEEDGIYFAKDLTKSILYSVAPPGTSQHLSMLAFDVTEFDNHQVRSILGRHSWFQTVTSDLPHFTYLGVAEVDLSTLGLKKVLSGDRPFWVPDI
jgi:hypothetical protein